jgi:hypothetical protein
MDICPVRIAVMTENGRDQLITKATVNAREVNVKLPLHILSGPV